MRLITETTDNNLELLVEEKASGKNFYIKGVFAQAETKNRNGRIYPKHVMEREVYNYNKKYINENRGMGELGHPDTPSINLDRVSHMIESLYPAGNDIMGKAKILKTPCGKIAEALLESGVKLGVSTRGVGSLKEQNGLQVVQEDFALATVDIVADPSAPSAYVNGIYEGAEWVYDEKLGWKTVSLAESHKKYIDNNKIDEAKAFRMFESFLNTLKG